MADDPLYSGAAIRRLRRQHDLTQAAMAGRLGISASYLNLIERNQRPLSARVVMKLADAFAFDPRTLREDEAIGGVEGLTRRLADERFAELGLDREEAAEFLASAPGAAAAFAKLYDTRAPAAESADDPLRASRRAIERWRNHFADLDAAAETLADELRLSRGDIGLALAERLRERHQLAIRILPREVMPDARRRLDLHARQVQLSEMLSAEARHFQLASQIATLEQSDAIDELVAGASLADEPARRLFRRHLLAYFAAALLMPYGRFLRACEATGYDIPVLTRRFAVSVEQVAHRLTTLQRVGQRGLPFFMGRIDRAGQFSKRFVGASATALFDGTASCPLWDVHRAFERPDRWWVQTLRLEDGAAGPRDWFTLSHATGGGADERAGQFAIVLGLELGLAANLAAARGKSLDAEQAQPVGFGCPHCRRADCRQRSLPPRGARLHFETTLRPAVPYGF